jgi:integrase
MFLLYFISFYFTIKGKIFHKFVNFRVLQVGLILQNIYWSDKHKVVETIVNDKRTLLLKDKTKNSSSYRSLPLIPEIKETLLAHKKEIENNKKLCGDSYNKEYKEYIFVDSTGKIFRPEYITDHFSLLLKKQNLRHIRFHDLRHSCASLLLAKNIPMKAIQEWLGHSTYSTTANLYTHLESNTKNVSANVLANAISFA